MTKLLFYRREQGFFLSLFLAIATTWYCGIKSPLGVQASLSYQAKQITLQVSLSPSSFTLSSVVWPVNFIWTKTIFSLRPLIKVLNGVRLRIGI